MLQISIIYTSEEKCYSIENCLSCPELDFCEECEKKYGEDARLIFEQFMEFGVLTLKQIIEQKKLIDQKILIRNIIRTKKPKSK